MKNLIGAVPMVTMAQSAANWRNTHTHVDGMHSLTQLHPHSYNTHVVRSSSSAISAYGIEFLFRRYLRQGEQTGVPGENPRQPAR